MKLQFKHQKFQADAAKAVVDVFAGQPYLTTNYRIDNGNGIYQTDMETSFTGWRNEQIVPELNDSIILEHLQKIQRTNQIEPSKQLEGHYNLTIEMETGVGKTYTYIKTMYELNKHYGWSKFIVVVPSVAIREGVYTHLEIGISFSWLWLPLVSLLYWQVFIPRRPHRLMGHQDRGITEKGELRPGCRPAGS